ncbi:MAG: NAD(P)-binding domain-containing protein [Lapillicoccus sp.]
MPTSRFAFLVHPRGRLAEDLSRIARPLGLVPEPVYDIALRRLPLPPVTMASVQLGGTSVGHVVLVPFGARHMLAQPAAARQRVSRAVDHAVRRGAQVVGLGALTAPVTGGGVSLRGRTDVAVTNGNAFTAAIVHDQVRELLATTEGARVAVIGATGSVGATLAQLLVRGRDADRLLLVARSENRLTALASRLSGRGTDVMTATDLRAAQDSDLVVLLTAAVGSVIEPEHLRLGAVVLDATQPRNTTSGLVRARPDVTVVDGGIVSVPSLRLRGGNVGLPDGRAYACFAETALLALSGHTASSGHFALGLPTLEQVDQVRELARRSAHLGFTLGAPTSFGQPLTLPRFAPPLLAGAVA